MVVLILAQSVAAESVTRISLYHAGELAETDLGITTGEVSPDGLQVLVGGANGYARLLSAEHADDRNSDVELLTGRNSTVRDISWHPRGITALLVGDAGMAMRYDSFDHSITYVNGTFSVLGHDLTAVAWRPAGDFAYVGAEDGNVWKFAEHTGFELLDNLGSSPVSDIACHRNYNVCFIATLNDGLAVIDGDHTMSWIGGSSSQTWIGVDCSNPVLNECIGFASGLLSNTIHINTMSPKLSSIGQAMKLDLDEGEHVGVSRGWDQTSLVYLAPLGIIRYDGLNDQAFTVLLPADVTTFDAVIAGRSLAVVWENKEHQGFLITEFGNVVSFSPAREEVDMGIMEILVFAAVAISVPGVILGLIYMNSPWLQRRYKSLRFSKK